VQLQVEICTGYEFPLISMSSPVANMLLVDCQLLIVGHPAEVEL